MSITDNRNTIISRLRDALQRGELSTIEKQLVDERIARPPRLLRPGIGELDQASLKARFIERFVSHAGEVRELAKISDVVQTVDAWVQQYGLNKRLLISHALVDVAAALSDFEFITGPAQGRHEIALSQAYGAIAEMGSLVMMSGPNSPITHNFVPDYHLVVLSASRIVGHYEDLWRLWRDSGKPMPRAVNIISGPSRTADVEQTIQLGAHGPRRLMALLVD